jgi:hypothetical protein
MSKDFTLNISREEAKLLRHILIAGTWDIINLSKDERIFINKISSKVTAYLVNTHGENRSI